MVCSHCKCAGHNFPRCPGLTQEEKEKKIKENKDKKKIATERRVRAQELYQREMEEVRKKKEELEKQLTTYEIINNTQDEISIYFAPNEGHASHFFTHFAYIPGNTSKEIRCNKDNHQLCIFHSLEVTKPETSQIYKSINDGNIHLRFKPVFKTKMCDFDGNIIIVDKEFVPKKTELEQWKESSLKANFLLEQIIKMGGKTYENIEPMLDMVEDINVPAHTDYDREIAGVPSKLTNIT